MKCLNCRKKQFCRGLCQACYSCARRLVDDGRITWEILEAREKARPVSHTHSYLTKKTKWFLEGNDEAQAV